MTTIRFLNTQDVSRALSVESVLNTVESVYVAKSNELTEVWPTIFRVFEEGKADLDIKSGYLKDRNLYGHKTVSWFGENESKHIPTLFGLIVVYDATTGAPLSVLDAAYITGLRTGAAGALGAKYLARTDSKTLLVVGGGNQAIFQIAAMVEAFPLLENIRVFDRTLQKAQTLVSSLPTRLQDEFKLTSEHITFEVSENLEETTRSSDIIITVTSAREPVIKNEWVSSGTHLSCIGADMEGKQELESALLQRAQIFVDDLPHCIEVGEIENPIKQQVITEQDIAGELGDHITGKLTGRTSADQITIFDATGMALLDIATAESALQGAKKAGLGTEVEL